MPIMDFEATIYCAEFRATSNSYGLICNSTNSPVTMLDHPFSHILPINTSNQKKWNKLMLSSFAATLGAQQKGNVNQLGSRFCI